MDDKIYNKAFQKDRHNITVGTAETVLGILMKVLKVRSVCDVGCGTGTWLSTFRSMQPDGIVKGFDGEYVLHDCNLEIQQDEFVSCDLNERVTDVRRYDLAISLEVAEHLLPERARTFVEDLTNLSDTVLFSAAIPGQGGEGHVNERLLSYWYNLFAQNGFVLEDIIRPRIWHRQDLPFWYRQNIVVFVKSGTLNESLMKFLYDRATVVDCIHPELFYGMVRACAEWERRYLELQKRLES